VSVVVEGIARPHLADLEAGTTPEVETWAEGKRPFVISVETDRITGRRLMPS
jgi:hypothetical protein